MSAPQVWKVRTPFYEEDRHHDAAEFDNLRALLSEVGRVAYDGIVRIDVPA